MPPSPSPKRNAVRVTLLLHENLHAVLGRYRERRWRDYALLVAQAARAHAARAVRRLRVAGPAGGERQAEDDEEAERRQAPRCVGHVIPSWVGG